MHENQAKTFVCDVCGTEYKDVNTCIRCEREHATVLETVAVFWSPELRFPRYIYFKDSTGKLVLFTNAMVSIKCIDENKSGRDPRMWNPLTLCVSEKPSEPTPKQPDTIWTRLMDTITRFWRG